MLVLDDFRFESHRLLLEIDASTNLLMMLVVARNVTGDVWANAVSRHEAAYEAWISMLRSSSISK